ncbi:MAG: TM0106 family RecB-like putative nuclease, partial [Actinomycetota bacterium]|nr:TM0106 family RecB-like putative nuclease [Actinomycetota bacterium]
GAADLAAGARATEEAMRAGAEVIYQAVFLEGDWRGLADFLERVERPSKLGPWSYEVADAKLARRPKPRHVLQLCFYSEQVARIQGVEPQFMHLLLGSHERETLRPRDFAAYYRRVRRRFLAAIGAGEDTYPYPVDHCSICDFLERCRGQWEADDHLVLVAGIRRDQITRLGEAGVSRLAELAAAPPALAVPRMVPSTFEKLREQAALQHAERVSGQLLYQLLAPEEKRGLALLPRPSPGDLFFDIEGDPFWQPERGLEYLFGVLSLDGGRPRFHAFWAHDRAEEQRAFERLVDFFHVRLAADPNLHVYHYAHYEPTVLKRLAALYGTREEELDDLLRRELFVDLLAVVRQSLRASRPSYSLKEIEAFYLRGREAPLRSGEDATVQYERWLETGDRSILDAIEAYNREDCLSTARLRDWLLERRSEAAALYGEEIGWWEAPELRAPSGDAVRELGDRARLREELLAGAEEGGERWLAGQLLDYHRREAKPVWWAFFERLKRTSTQLVDDSESIGELRWDGRAPEERGRSLVFGFTFPAQEHRLGLGDEAYDPLTGERAGTIVELDDAAGTLRLVRGPILEEVPLPRALIPGGPYPTTEQRNALTRLGRAIQSREGGYRALRRVLRREPAGRPIQTTELDEMQRLVADLDGDYLFVQGPPGAGKTWTGARLIVHLLGLGQRVGVAATSHKAIHNLLDEIEEAAIEARRSFRALKKCSGDSPESRYEGRLVENEAAIPPFLDPDVRLLAGTAWLFAREELDGQLDYLFIDEAGQVSLADALAMGTSARNLVLLGDPLQLAQVTQGLHPRGTNLSVLGHLLGNERTIPIDRGLFLERSWRMHPDVSAFVSEAFYEGRLRSAERCARQRTAFDTGIRYVPVEHDGNRQSAPEEGRAIREQIERMLGGDYRDADGLTRPLAEEDFMVVAPYNAQVRCLRECLPGGVRVGTVDKFQGQESPVVFFSMTSSSGEDIPRNLGFLFSRNRLNVAVSRARCLAFLVASPRLLEINCRTVEQMRLANALCLLVERAEDQSRRSTAPRSA